MKLYKLYKRFNSLFYIFIILAVGISSWPAINNLLMSRKRSYVLCSLKHAVHKPKKKKKKYQEHVLLPGKLLLENILVEC